MAREQALASATWTINRGGREWGATMNDIRQRFVVRRTMQRLRSGDITLRDAIERLTDELRKSTGQSGNVGDGESRLGVSQTRPRKHR